MTQAITQTRANAAAEPSVIGIAGDMIRMFIHYIYGFGIGVTRDVTTNGATLLLPDVNRLVPEFTIYADPSNDVTVYFGNQNGTFPLVAGSSYSFRFKNPTRSQLVVDDRGTPGQLIHIGG